MSHENVDSGRGPAFRVHLRSGAVGANSPAARKPCDDLKTEIAKKLDANNVGGYSLTVVDKGKEGDAKVVGSCDGGAKSLTYARGEAVSTAAAAQPSETKKSQ